MTRTWCTPITGGVRLTLLIAPNARKSESAGVLDGVLKVRLQAQPIEGKANEALTRYIADTLRVPKSTVKLVRGQTSRQKTVEVLAGGLTVAGVMQVLNPDESQ